MWATVRSARKSSGELASELRRRPGSSAPESVLRAGRGVALEKWYARLCRTAPALDQFLSPNVLILRGILCNSRFLCHTSFTPDNIPCMRIRSPAILFEQGLQASSNFTPLDFESLALTFLLSFWLGTSTVIFTQVLLTHVVLLHHLKLHVLRIHLLSSSMSPCGRLSFS